MFISLRPAAVIYICRLPVCPKRVPPVKMHQVCDEFINIVYIVSVQIEIEGMPLETQASENEEGVYISHGSY